MEKKVFYYSLSAKTYYLINLKIETKQNSFLHLISFF